MSKRKETALPGVEVLTPLLYETGQDFHDLKHRAELTEQGAVLFILNWHPGKRRPPRWKGHSFTPELLEALREVASRGSDPEVRERAQVLLEYYEGLTHRGAAERLGRCMAYFGILLKAVVRDGVSEDVLRFPLNYRAAKGAPPQQAQ